MAVNQVLRNPYEVLGVSKTASGEAIKAAYRKLALQYHPDRNPGDRQAEERFKEISEAYATLRDPVSRERFDRYGSSRPEASRPDFATVDWQTIFREADLNIDWDARGGAAMPRTGHAVFDMLFGYLGGMMRNAGLLPGEDRQLELAVPLAQARAGGERRIQVPGPSVCAECRGRGRRANGQPCPLCSGRGVLRSGAVVDVNVPAGVRDGVKLRLKGLGGPGQPPGDVLMSVRLQVPRQVRLLGNDIYVDLPVTPLEAQRGSSFKVLGESVRLPADSKDGSRLRVAGAGLAGGDMIITVRHRLWQGIWRKIRDQFGALAPALSEGGT